jgi:glycosyltransferase involved in cell wall biosynthesis
MNLHAEATSRPPGLRVLVVTTSYTFPSDGRPMAGVFWANLLERLSKLLAGLAIVTPTAYLPAPLLRLKRFAVQRQILPYQTWNGAEVHRPAYLSLRTGRHIALTGWFFRRPAERVSARLHALAPFDIVVGYELGVPAYAARCIARRLGIPCVSWAIGDDVNTMPHRSPHNLAFFRRNVADTDLVLTESDALRRAILADCPGARNVHAYYKGIDLAEIRNPPQSRSALRAGLGLTDDTPYMISAGAAMKVKGVLEFYEAFARLSQAVPKLRAIWIGGGVEEGELKRLAQGDGLAPRFQVTGAVARSTVLEYMRAADVMAFPSYGEGLPNVVMEALACGLPTVTTDVGGTSEVLAHERTGLLVPPRDAAALADGIRRVLADRPWAEELARRGQKLILEHFDVDKNAPVALEILQRVARREPPETPVQACAGVRPGRLPVEELQA